MRCPDMGVDCQISGVAVESISDRKGWTQFRQKNIQVRLFRREAFLLKSRPHHSVGFFFLRIMRRVRLTVVTIIIAEPSHSTQLSPCLKTKRSKMQAYTIPMQPNMDTTPDFSFWLEMVLATIVIKLNFLCLCLCYMEFLDVWCVACWWVFLCDWLGLGRVHV